MKNVVGALILTVVSLNCFALSKTILSCTLGDCESCQILIDTKNEKAEYMDNESSHILKQISKTKSTRVFKVDPEPQIPSPGYLLKFDRQKKSADLFRIHMDQSEMALYKDLKCDDSNLKFKK